jgi:hypothetical protein
MNTSSFNPISFLKIDYLSLEKQEELTPKLWQHMAYYLLTRFLEKLPEDKYLEVESKAKVVKTPEEVLELVAQYDPEFEAKKISWLEDYKHDFDINLIKEAK